MAKQLYWKDVKIGDEIPNLSKIASTRTLVEWASVSNDFNPLHYEDTFAKAQGLAGPIIHGQLKLAWLVHMMTDWIGERGILRRLSCRFLAVDYPRLMKTITDFQEGETWQCKGKVTNKYCRDNEYYVECEIWVENGKGERTTLGNAMVLLPSITRKSRAR